MNQIDILSLMAFLVTGLTLYVVCYACAVRLRRHLNGKLGWLMEWLFPALKVETWLFEPIAGPDLPPKQREYFGAHTPEFLARRFTLLGDFVLRRDREPSCVRLFLSPDGTVLGGLSCYLGNQLIDAITVLMDGTYLETSTIWINEPPPKEHGLRFFSHPTTSVLDLVDHHAGCVARVVAETSADPTVLEPNEFQAVMNYGRQLSYRSLHKQGFIDELPEFLKRKEAAATVAT